MRKVKTAYPPYTSQAAFLYTNVD